MKTKIETCQKRRKQLIETIKQAHPNVDGLALFFAGFEHDYAPFRQESSFFYFTGLNEPGVALAIDMQHCATLYTPNCVQTRAKWVASPVMLEQKNAQKVGFDGIKTMGAPCTGYQMYPFAAQAEYETLINDVKNALSENKKIFVLNPLSVSGYLEQRFILGRLQEWIPELKNAIVDMSSIVADMRCKKDMGEIEALREAIEITQLAHEAAARSIEPGMIECEVQASLEYVMTAAGATRSFPSIVGSGKNSTVLHYQENNAELKKGDLVVIDIGAEKDFYCADITRTYPVSGTFTKRQREIYNLVLETQTYIAQLAAPGYWLSNKEHPDKSLNHLAKAYLEKRGYGKYFPHGIGHYLGLDVHDVGDYTKPLQEGDVITIEPGIYIPEENLGVRIEDNYWIVKGGAVCLSEDLPKRADDIEAFVQAQFNENENDDFNAPFSDDESEAMS